MGIKNYFKRKKIDIADSCVRSTLFKEPVCYRYYEKHRRMITEAGCSTFL